MCTRGNRNQIGVGKYLHRMSTLDVHGCGVVSIKKLVRLGTGNFALKKACLGGETLLTEAAGEFI